MVLVYAGLVPRKSGKAFPQELTVRAKILLHVHRNDTIVLPTIAVSEVLVPVPTSQKGALAATLSGRFVCQSFDLPAAAIAAELWSQHKNLPRDLQYHDRHVLRSDAMIVASVKSAGATEFFSHDRKCRALADLVMNAQELPKWDPNDMFLLGDIQRGEV
jgi:hypothetical protein